MARPHYFLIPPDSLPTNPSDFAAEILGKEVTRHLAALRIRPGQDVVFLDGEGTRWHCQCRQERPLAFSLQKTEKLPSLKPDLRLCLVPPKGDALSETIAQATEMGVTQILFINGKHRAYPDRSETPHERARRVSHAALEQCGRPWRCQIHEGWHELKDSLELSGFHVVADESTAEPGQDVESLKLITENPSLPFPRSPSLDPVFLYVGPEGGWADSERQLFDTRATRLALGSLILRVPTAVVAGVHHLRALYWNKCPTS